MRTHFHCDVAHARREGRQVVIARVQVGSLCSEEIYPSPGSGEVELSLRCEQEWFDLGFVQENGQRKSLARVEARFLSTEIARGFAGLFIAPYAQGGQKGEKASWAQFREFRYR